MNKNYNLKLLREHYSVNGWVIIKKLIDLDEIKEIKTVIKNFIKEQSNQPFKLRSINFTNNSDDIKNLKNLEIQKR